MPPAIVGVLALVVFAVLATSTAIGTRIETLDQDITRWAVLARTDGLTPIFRFLTFVGSSWFLTPLALGAIALFLWLRRFRVAGVFAASVLTGLLLTTGLKLLFGRDRPPAGLEIGSAVSTGSFPSGHTLNSTVIIGLVLMVAALYSRRRWAQIVAVLGWLLTIAAIASSRIYLGYHWLSDVLGGFTLGLAILAFTLIALSRAHHADENARFAPEVD